MHYTRKGRSMGWERAEGQLFDRVHHESADNGGFVSRRYRL